MSKRAAYRVLSPVEWDGVRYEIDATVEMPDSVARQLVEVGAVRREDDSSPHTPVTSAKPGDGGGGSPPPPEGESGIAGANLERDPGDERQRTAADPEGSNLPDTDRHAAIVDAIGGLDPEDKRLWSGRGKSRKPRVDAIEAVLGYDITAAERDAAWAIVQDGG